MPPKRSGSSVEEEPDAKRHKTEEADLEVADEELEGPIESWLPEVCSMVVSLT
jgi:hypothetical protein